MLKLAVKSNNMSDVDVMKRAGICIDTQVCFISMQELNKEDIEHEYHSVVGMTVPIHRKYKKD